MAIKIDRERITDLIINNLELDIQSKPERLIKASKTADAIIEYIQSQAKDS
jgi:hypothetical protein